MAEQIVAIFDTVAHADAAQADLSRIHPALPANAVRRYRPGEAGASGGSLASASTDTTGHTQTTSKGGFWSWLFGEDTTHTTTHEDHDFYNEQEDVGRALSVWVEDHAQATEVMRILEGHHPDTINAEPEGMAGSTTSATAPAVGSTGATSGAAMGTTGSAFEQTARRSGERTGSEEVIPLSEEQLSVGKRVVDRGTTRIRRYVVEKPAEASVNLRDEHTTVERRAPAANTPVGSGAFEDRTVEVRNTREEPVVEKNARVGEEVVVHKDATDRTETVRDTVRHEEVDVDKDRGSATTPTNPTAPINRP